MEGVDVRLTATTIIITFFILIIGIVMYDGIIDVKNNNYYEQKCLELGYSEIFKEGLNYKCQKKIFKGETYTIEYSDFIGEYEINYKNLK